MKDIFAAISFLTRVPLPKGLNIEEKDFANSYVYFPVVGLLLGLVLVLANTILTQLFPNGLVNAALLLFIILLTGGRHLNDLADTVDRLYPGKGPRPGAPWVICLAMVLLFEYALLCGISPKMKDIALILMCSISRWGQVFALFLSGDRKVGRLRIFLATFFTVFVSLTAWLFKGLLVFIITCILVLAAARYARKKAGGITGAINEMAEIITLFLVLCGI